MARSQYNCVGTCDWCGSIIIHLDSQLSELWSSLNHAKKDTLLSFFAQLKRILLHSTFFITVNLRVTVCYISSVRTFSLKGCKEYKDYHRGRLSSIILVSFSLFGLFRRSLLSLQIPEKQELWCIHFNRHVYASWRFTGVYHNTSVDV